MLNQVTLTEHMNANSPIILSERKKPQWSHFFLSSKRRYGTGKRIYIYIIMYLCCRNARKLFEKNAAPILHLAGIEVNVVKVMTLLMIRFVSWGSIGSVLSCVLFCVVFCCRLFVCFWGVFVIFNLPVFVDLQMKEWHHLFNCTVSLEREGRMNKLMNFSVCTVLYKAECED